MFLVSYVIRIQIIFTIPRRGRKSKEQTKLLYFISQIIDKDINPFVEEWENNDTWFPAHEVFKKLGDAGLLGLTKPAGTKYILIIKFFS